MKTAKEIADELDAEDKLISRGWTQEKCVACDGTGHSTRNPDWFCLECGGKGTIWTAPTAKTQPWIIDSTAK